MSDRIKTEAEQDILHSKPSYEELEQRVRELEKAEQELSKSEQRYRFLIDATTSIYWTTDASGGFIHPQPSWEQYTGQPWKEHKGFGWTKMIHPNDVDRIYGVWQKARKENTLYATWGQVWNEARQQFRDFEVQAVPILDKNGEIYEWTGFIVDITERKQAEKQLKTSLAEKDVLLRELHHRTKNTLQIVRSMLLLRSAKFPENEQVQKLASDIEQRMMAMALVHERLYQAQDLSHIPMKDYLHELVALIMQTTSHISQNIDVIVESTPCALQLDMAIPCGLIVNELLSNALKYAFSPGQKGKILIQFMRKNTNTLGLLVSDTGKGVPPDFDFRAQPTLGLQTVFALAEQQLQGKIECCCDQGVSCSIEFPDVLYQERLEPAQPTKT